MLCSAQGFPLYLTLMPWLYKGNNLCKQLRTFGALIDYPKCIEHQVHLILTLCELDNRSLLYLIEISLNDHPFPNRTW